MKKEAEEIDAALMTKTNHQPMIPKSAWLSTGNTLLNLALSGRTYGGVTKNHYVWLLGDSESGKSAYALQILAEASINPHFKKHRLIYDDVETGIFQFPIRKFYGKELDRRIEPLVGTKQKPENSVTIQNFFRKAFAALKNGPCILVQDSMDALDEEVELEDFKTASSKDKKTKNTMGMGKARENAKNIKRLISCLPFHGSILLIVNQTSENIDRPTPYSPKTKPGAGGKKLRFYAHAQVWTSIASPISKEVFGVKEILGYNINIAVKKNRISGRNASVRIPFLTQSGFDETGSMIDFLATREHWVKQKGIILAKEFKVTLARNALIAHVESRDERMELLRKITGAHWERIQNELLETRKPRYE